MWRDGPVEGLSISGTVRYWQGMRSIPGVDVKLALAADPKAVIAVTKAGVEGRFLFEGLDFDDYVLTANTPVKSGSAVDSGDYLALLKLMAGRNPIPDPDGPGPLRAASPSNYQQIAADLDQNSIVNTVDLRAIFAQSTSSREMQSVSLVTNEFDQPMKVVTPASENVSDITLVFVLLGDLDGSWNPWGTDFRG